MSRASCTLVVDPSVKREQPHLSIRLVCNAQSFNGLVDNSLGTFKIEIQEFMHRFYLRTPHDNLRLQYRAP